MRELWLALLVNVITRASSVEASAADLDLFRRIVERDADAFAQLYARHGKAVFSLALRVLGDQAAAEDVVQDVFGQAWRQAERFNPARGHAVAWLLNMARSRAIDLLRRRRSLVVVPQEETHELVFAGPGPEDVAAANVDAAMLRAALDGLPLVQRLPIELAYFEGLSQAEIAQRLEEPLGTVKTRVRLGLQKLREALAGSKP